MGTLLCLFLSCFEIQNVLGLWEGMDLVLPQPDLTKCSHLGECWVGNKCQFDVQCGENGNCKNRQKIGNGFWPTGVCDCKQTKCKLMKPCIVGRDNTCGEHGICTPDRFCPYKRKMGMGKGIGMGYGMGMEENQDKLWP